VAIRAGYSKKSAYSIGVENLNKPELKKYIDKRMKEKEEDAPLKLKKGAPFKYSHLFFVKS